MTNRRLGRRLGGITALSQPQRLALYELVANSVLPMSRDEAAQALGIPRSVAAFHLDRLEADGLLEAEFRRPEGRTGPGAGRPTKRYRRSKAEISLSVPERQYAFAAGLMVQAIKRSREAGISIEDALGEAAGEAGRELGARTLARHSAAEADALSANEVQNALDEFGYETVVTPGRITLRNCPFRALADQDTELVCGMNLRFIAGLLDASANPGLSARLEPSEDCCCVPIRVAEGA